MSGEVKINYPSVTQVLKPYIDLQWFKDEHRIRGQKVHAAALCDLQGLWFPPLEPEYQGYFDSWKRWADKMILEVIMVETRLHDHDWRVKGRPDLAAILKGDTAASLLDIKTSQAAQKSWPLQIAAYRHLAKKDKGISTHRGTAIRLKSDGSGCLINEYARDYRKDLNVFTGLLNAHYYFEKGGSHD